MGGDVNTSDEVSKIHLRQVYGRTKSLGLLQALLLAITLTILLFDEMKPFPMGGWAAAFTLVQGLRARQLNSLLRVDAQEMEAGISRGFVCGLFCSGLLWGVWCAAGFYATTSLVSSVVMLIVPGLCGMAISTVAGHRIALFAYATPAIVPTMVCAFMAGGKLNIVLGCVFAFGFASTMIVGRRVEKELLDAIAAKLELARTYARTLELEKSAALAVERQRIVRNIHDDIGTQLMSAIPLVSEGQISSAQTAAILQECIDGLRLTIDSLKPLGNDLAAVLGNFRYRFESRLLAAGLKLRWDVDDLPASKQLSPEVISQIMRIVQEAVTNAIKHAGANMLYIHASHRHAEKAIAISVIDDGRGFATLSARTGDGLTNMRWRAERIGAQLRCKSSKLGTNVTVLFPLDKV